MANNLKIIRMLGVGDIVAEVSNKNGSTVILTNPCHIIGAPELDENGNPKPDSYKIGMERMLQPYMNSVFVEIDKRHILFMTEVQPQIADKYDSIFSRIIQPKNVNKTESGIIVP